VADDVKPGGDGPWRKRWRWVAIPGAILLAVAVVMILAEPFAKNSSEASVVDLIPQGCIKDTDSTAGCGQSTAGMEGAKSVAVSPDGTSVYVAAAWAPALVRFDRDPATGALTPQGCITDTIVEDPECATQTYGLSGAESVTVSPDGQSVYVAGTIENAVVRFDRDTSTGALTPAGCVQDNDEFLAECAQTADGLSQVRSVAVSPDGKSVYAASNEDDAVVEFGRSTGGDVGALEPRGCVDDEAPEGRDDCEQSTHGLDGAAAVAVSPDGKSVYAASENDNAVVRFDRNTSTGALTAQGCVDDSGEGPDLCAGSAAGLRGADSLALSPDGTSLYVGSRQSDAIARFARSTSTGALTSQGCVESYGGACDQTIPGLFGPTGLAMSPDGGGLYAAAIVSTVVGLDRDASTGALAFAGCVTEPTYPIDGCETTADGLDGAFGVAVSPEGNSVYVVSEFDDAIVRFGRVLASRLSGHVRDAEGHSVVGAPVEICADGGGACISRFTDSGGEYRATGLADGSYTLTARPPVGFESEPGRAGPVVISAGGAVIQDIDLGEVLHPIPAGVTISNRGVNEAGIPTVHWVEDLDLSASACPGASAAAYRVLLEGAAIREGPMIEGPSGTYTARIPQLSPNHGAAVVKIEVTCPSGPPDTISFGIYIDPSGLVHNAGTGAPIGGATVTLLRSENPGGPFATVPNGSAIMSAGNRANPDTTDPDGSFGWDVIAGYYQVHAAAAGCSGETTGVLTIPPPVTNLDLRLACQGEGGQSPPTVQPVAPRPSNAFTMGKLKLNTAKGTATLSVGVPGPGKLTLSGKQVKKASKAIAAAGKAKLAIVPKGSAKEKLGKTGTAKVKIKVAFTPTGGQEGSRTKTVKLMKR